MQKKKKNFDLNLGAYTDQKRIMDLNLKSKSIKFLEGNIKENFGTLALSKIFLNFISKAWAIKENIHKFNFTKIKNYSLQEAVRRMKILAIYILEENIYRSRI